MPSIKGTLTVTNKDWKYVYNSVLNFLNEEVENAYNKANAFYTKIKEDGVSQENAIQNFDTLIETLSPSTYQKSLISSALFSGTNSYIYSPKKNNFKRYTNRTVFVDIGSIKLDIDKKNCTINLETQSFQDFDSYILVNTFLSEFINMVNTIPWPTRNGPSKAVRGCKLFTVESDESTITVFYKSGPRPPELNNSYTINDITTGEPNHLSSTIMKSMQYVSSSQEETAQPIPEAIDSFDDF
jgi:hypothetical protein